MPSGPKCFKWRFDMPSGPTAFEVFALFIARRVSSSEKICGFLSEFSTCVDKCILWAV